MLGTTTLHRLAALAAISVMALLLAPLAAHAAGRTVTTTSSQRASAAAAATARLGAPYQFGSIGPRSFDCSGLLVSAYRSAGVDLTARTSFDMWNIGKPVNRAALQPGDLVWTWDRTLGHVGVYVGRGMYVHAPGKGRKVERSALPTGPGYIGAIRP